MFQSQWSNTIYVKGCIIALEEWLPRNLYIVAGVFIVISLLQVLDVLKIILHGKYVLQLDVTLSTFIYRVTECHLNEYKCYALKRNAPLHV